jgi:hypothetical protein
MLPPVNGHGSEETRVWRSCKGDRLRAEARPPELRRRALDRLETGRSVRDVAASAPGQAGMPVPRCLSVRRMHTELLDRRRWRTRVDLANAIFRVHRRLLHPPSSSPLRTGLAQPHHHRATIQATISAVAVPHINRLAQAATGRHRAPGRAAATTATSENPPRPPARRPSKTICRSMTCPAGGTLWCRRASATGGTCGFGLFRVSGVGSRG